ncbi:MAG: hypothetical protein WA864_28885 [Acetobacteraceae bacterium]
MSGSKNLIMGFCARLPFRRLEPFVTSLRNVAFAGDVCLQVQDVAADTIEQLRAHGVIVERIGPTAQPRMTAMASRYFSFQDFLLRRGESYANVLLTDPATTVFQADPFAAPLPADIVYTAEPGRIDDTPAVRDAVVQAYGEAVAHNIRDCTASNADTTAGTRSGMLRYLAAMVHQLAGRTTPITGAIDRGVHNYLVHMRPLRGAWLNTADTLSSTHEPPASATDAVVAFYLHERDADWLDVFLGSLHCVNDSVAVYCVGDFNQDDQAILARHRCTGYVVPTMASEIADNVAHFYLSQILDRIASDAAVRLDQVLVIDNMRAIFQRDPFLNKTIGLSVFCEGPARIGESDYNRARLGFFVAAVEDGWLSNPVVSSMVLRGALPVVREFYRRMLIELVGRTELLRIQKVVQGLVNKLCHGGGLGFPVIAHPNAAEVYFDFPECRLGVDTRYGVRVGGAVPAVVPASHSETPLMRKLRIDLNLPET